MELSNSNSLDIINLDILDLYHFYDAMWLTL